MKDDLINVICQWNIDIENYMKIIKNTDNLMVIEQCRAKIEQLKSCIADIKSNVL